jgi:hypothetical protein
MTVRMGCQAEWGWDRFFSAWGVAVRMGFDATLAKHFQALSGELCISRASGQWEEEQHLDGGASILHMGMTIYGRRALICEQGAGEEAIGAILRSAPGPD